VHFGRPSDGAAVRPGDLVEVVIDYAAPHHLVANQPPVVVRRTRAGDAWAAREAAPAPARGVLLGMPTTRPVAADVSAR
jgi:tRNA-2-methylthio-N6-dimethylallyladenosine synthase